MYITISGPCRIDNAPRGYGKVQLTPHGEDVALTFRGKVDADMPEVVFEIQVATSELKKAMICL